MPHASVFWIRRNAMLVRRIFLERREFHLDPDFRLMLLKGADQIERAGDEFAGLDLLSRDFDGADELGAEDIVIFNLEFQVIYRMCQWYIELLVPLRVRGVLNDASACHGGLGDRNGDVWITGDDLAVVVTTSVGFGGGVTWIDSVTGGEATAEMLRHEVHVRQVYGLDDFQIQVTVEVN